MNILQFIKSLFADKNPFALGAILNEPDNRDIPYPVVSAGSPITQPHIEVPGFYTTERLEQGQLGTCVAHAFEFIRRAGDKTIHSRRIPYTLTRNALGWTEGYGQGLPQREAAKTYSVVGQPKDSGVDDNSLSHRVYSSLEITQEMRDDANVYRFGGFAFPIRSVEGIKQALADGKFVAVTVGIDWGAIDKDGTVRPIKRLVGFHEVIIGQSDDKEGRFRFANWWGKGWGTEGDGFINYSEVEHVIFDAITFVDIPEDLKLRAKQTQFIFLSDLSFGSDSLANIQLQRRLAQYGLFSAIESRKFGPATMKAVLEYQKLKGLPQTGYVGKMTRNELNGDMGAKTKSKIDLWCEAATKMEGAKAENHNPGNLRFVGQKEAIGQDYRGFCIFPNDAVGYKMLRDTFVRACSGNSKVYTPEMNLYTFYKIYAPSTDGNSPRHYANFVADYMGVSVGDAIKTFL